MAAFSQRYLAQGAARKGILHRTAQLKRGPKAMASRSLQLRWRYEGQDAADPVRDDRVSRVALFYKLETD
jgi:hypothetical protein